MRRSRSFSVARRRHEIAALPEFGPRGGGVAVQTAEIGAPQCQATTAQAIFPRGNAFRLQHARPCWRKPEPGPINYICDYNQKRVAPAWHALTTK